MMMKQFLGLIALFCLVLSQLAFADTTGTAPEITQGLADAGAGAATAAVPDTRPVDTGTWAGLRQEVLLGMRATTRACPLCLLLLMVLAPPVFLTVSGGRWGKSGGWRRSARQLLRVTAYGAAGSLLSMGASYYFLRHPGTLQNVVEVAMAVLVIIAAIHAARPVLPGGEPWLAAAFGVVYGASCVQILAGSGSNHPTWYVAWTIIAFNGGKAIVQLVWFACLLPWLSMIADTPLFTAFRNVVAALCASVALGAIVQLLWTWPHLPANPIAQLIAQPLWVYYALVILAIALSLVDFSGKRRRNRSEDL